MDTVGQWTGREARALRVALRFSVRVFAERLGIAARTISKWEKAGDRTTPWPDTQAMLDKCLAQAPSEAKARFAALPSGALAVSTEQAVSRNATARALLTMLLADERKSATPGLRALASRAGVLH